MRRWRVCKGRENDRRRVFSVCIYIHACIFVFVVCIWCVNVCLLVCVFCVCICAYAVVRIASVCVHVCVFVYVCCMHVHVIMCASVERRFIKISKCVRRFVLGSKRFIFVCMQFYV